ncbi:hypothetical protein Tco_0570134 [Tanacetum coccineum]
MHLHLVLIQHPSSSFILDSSPVHSSGLDASDQAHSGSSTRDVPPRLCYPPRRAPRRSEAFRRWCAAPLSTLYPPTHHSPHQRFTKEPMQSSSHSAGHISQRGLNVRDHVEIESRDVKDDTKEYEVDASARDTVEICCTDFYHPHWVRIDRIVGIKTAQRRLEADQLIARGQRVSMIERIDSLRLENLKVRAMLDIKRDRVNSFFVFHMSLST